MANGKRHARWTMFGVISSAVASSYMYASGNTDGIGVIAGAVIGHMLTPDIDMGQLTTHEEHRMYAIHPAMGSIWQLYWLPYGKFIKHRSWLSHAPIIGTIGRLLYLFGPMTTIMYYQGYELAISHWMAYAFVSWCLQDIVHLALDGFGYSHD